MSHECQYCKKKLSTKSNLNLHQKTTISCLDIQKSLNISVVSLKVACEYCNETYGKHNLSKHLLICKAKPSREIIEISMLRTELNIIKKESTNLKGVTFIGDISAAWFEINDDFNKS